MSTDSDHIRQQFERYEAQRKLYFKRMKENDARKKRQTQTSGLCLIQSFLSLFLFVFIFVGTGFSRTRSFQVYHHPKFKFLHYQCPYYTKTGSCSTVFKEGGIKALAQKCNQHRIESCQ